MSLIKVETHHPSWHGYLQFSTEDLLVEHVGHASRGRYSLDGEKITVHWDNFPPEVFIIGQFGALFHESIKPQDIRTLMMVSIDGSSFPLTTAWVMIENGTYEVGMRLGSTDIPTFSQIFVRREYESANLPEKASSIIDLGSNVGYATVFFGLKYKNAKILSVEPEAENFRMLERNVRALGSRVIALRGAVWCKDGEINLITENEDGAVLGGWGIQVSAKTTEGGLTAPCWKLSTLVEKFGFEEIDVLKVDIEGAEVELFSEKPEDWLAKVKFLIIETHDRFRSNSEEVVRSVLAADFEELPPNSENLFFRRKRLLSSAE